MKSIARIADYGKRNWLRALPLVALFTILFAQKSFAQDDGPSPAEVGYAIDNMMLFIAAILVLFMQAGFALVESGFNASKNALNIMFKNFIDVNVGVLTFWLFGYGIMYGSAVIPGWLGWGGFGISAVGPTPAAGALNPQIDWLFQVAFAATAATIVSGAVAGRMQFSGYLIYSIFITSIVYPISGFWKWGGGWLDAMGFHDFAGSLVVHAVGGFAGLAGAMLLGPRIGRFAKDGSSVSAPHNYTLATLGVFILWIGWYGFNPGSQLAFVGAGNTDAVVLIAVNTTLAAAGGAVAALILSHFVTGKFDLGLALNGMLGGLVGITANCDAVTNSSAIVIGLVAGVVMIGATLLLERLKIDDAVGAFPVHGACGVWGGLAAAIFGGKPFVAQLVGSIAIPLWAFGMAFLLFSVLKATKMLRVSPEEEMEGLDISEHGARAYSPMTGAAVSGD
ncbi:MAG: ammonium transporter [Caldilineaceae bacterium]|nr:ammonium transporter [Caldilineaceae bacterium]